MRFASRCRVSCTARRAISKFASTSPCMGDICAIKSICKGPVGCTSYGLRVACRVLFGGVWVRQGRGGRLFGKVGQFWSGKGTTLLISEGGSAVRVGVEAEASRRGEFPWNR